ncbi:reticulon-4-interacting protein 1 homolog, mitochondrial [Coregonus clupeaformis]|uniref:reticulon-4-interacting protein 1 homolog, mitochondrial n=1 Tax=Coregonus clupeaformis TaxID=59861 RepID=UPI001E1C5EF1|nr:reticulon-4-interacting protein 1 homolog, mitochondrial [Coregonus clupeaformis]
MGSVKVTACCRQLFLPYARALALTTKMASGNIICCLRRNLSSSSRLRSSMPAWVIDEYGNNGVLRFTEEATAPSVNSASEVLIQVHAASLNPLDISMRGGYGSNLLKLRRDPVSLGQNGSEFPIILGRDVSGVVVDCGSGVTHFKPGDEVWAAIPPWKQGSLAEMVNLTEYEVSHKPRSLSHMEAVSIPYVAATALSALVNAGGLCRNNCANKRVLITGASGGVGTFSIQLLKAWGAHVTVTCSHNAEGLVRGLGADEVVDYTAGDVAAQLGLLEKFDVILDNVGGDSEQWALGMLKSWSGAKYVTLVTPFLLNIDSMGLLEGAVHSGLNLHQKAITNMCKGVFYRWGFYAPDGPALDEVSQLVDAGKILPVVEATFPFSQVPQAFQKLEGGHARGKTVVTVAQEEEGTRVTEEEGEVETSDTPEQVREEVKEAVPKR